MFVKKIGGVASAVFTALLKLDRIYSCRLTHVLTQLRWAPNASNISWNFGYSRDW